MWGYSSLEPVEAIVPLRHPIQGTTLNIESSVRLESLVLHKPLHLLLCPIDYYCFLQTPSHNDYNKSHRHHKWVNSSGASSIGPHQGMRMVARDLLSEVNGLAERPLL